MDIPTTPPQALIVAGPNGSGKSTLIRDLRSGSDLPFPERYINADDIARELTEGTQEEKERAAFRQARELRRVYREQGISHAFETVLSHPSGLLDLMKLRDAGFEVTLAFVTTSDPKINIGRVARRVRLGGHDVPIGKIAERYERTLSFLPRAVEIVSRAYIFDSSRRTRLAAMAEYGALMEETAFLPAYLVERLATPLTERQEARERLRTFCGGEMPEIPNEEGVYEGEILAVEPHHVLQENPAGRPFLHDVLLLAEPIPPDKIGTPYRIAYKDGYGTTERG